MPFPVLAAILRIGRRYQIEHFQDERLRRLREESPKDNLQKTWNCGTPVTSRRFRLMKLMQTQKT